MLYMGVFFQKYAEFAAMGGVHPASSRKTKFPRHFRSVPPNHKKKIKNEKSGNE
jgi:hypothetical protein